MLKFSFTSTIALLNVTDEDVTASGLTADEDADNDGIADSEDSTPIGN